MKNFRKKFGSINGIQPLARPPIALAEKNQGRLLMELLMEALRAGNETMVALASELIVRSGPQAVHCLVLEAADWRNSPRFRVRVLEVVERIGVIPDLESYFDLQIVAADKNDEVRGAASRVLMSTGGRHVGTSHATD